MSCCPDSSAGPQALARGIERLGDAIDSADAAFVEDEGWHRAQERYCDFLRQHAGERVLFLELGVGFNSPGVIKYPFWQMALANENARYACVNRGEAWAPKELRNRSIVLNADLSDALHKLATRAAKAPTARNLVF